MKIKNITFFLLAAIVMAGCSESNKYQRAGGDAIGEECSKVSFSVDKMHLHSTTGDYIYSLFFDPENKPENDSITAKIFNFIGDGEPDPISIKSEIYLFDNKTNEINLIATIEPPEEWSHNAVAYSTKTRIMPSGSVYVAMKGCEKYKVSCGGTKFFRIDKNYKIKEVDEWPSVSRKEKYWSKMCASTTEYSAKEAKVSFFKRNGELQQIAVINNSF